MAYKARWNTIIDDGIVQCTLCPHQCILKEGKAGICRVRINSGGKLVTDVYGYVSAINFDPIEKKPLYHFYPGSSILSIGTYGCNLRCFFCQNCAISQTAAEPELPHIYYTPEQIVEIAIKKPGNTGIAFTYNEPIVWFEYMLEIAKLAKKSGLQTVMVTNGFINTKPLEELLQYIDAFSVDLKAFNEEFYTKVASARLDPVKKSLIQISQAGKHLELVNLVIPDLNDDDLSFTAMTKWIASEIGKDTVLHISKYFPGFKLHTEATPSAIINRLKRIAERELTYVYTGNIFEETNNTLCIQCQNILITRHAYSIDTPGLDSEGNCKDCGKKFHKKT
jgi:pyruvate formate lyase activating enzyme